MFMKRSFSACFPFVILCLFLLPADFPLEATEIPEKIPTVVVTGSRLAENLEDIPAPAYMVTREDIEKSGARNVQDVLNRLPGVVGLVNGASMTQPKGITIRTLTTEVLLLVDGVPMMTTSYGTGAVLGMPFDLRTIPLESVERIEVVKGASSAIYGSHAAAGVINIITRAGADESQWSLKTEAGSLGWFRGSFRGTAAGDGFSATAGYMRTREGEINLRLLPGGGYDRARDFNGDDFFVRLDGKKWRFLAEWGNSSSSWDFTDFLGVRDENRLKNDYHRISVNYFDGVNTARIYSTGNSKDVFDLSGFTNFDDTSFGASFSHRQNLFGVPAVWGVDWRREKGTSVNRDNPYGNDDPYDLSRTNIAPFAEFSIPLGDIALDLGLRYESWSGDRGAEGDEFIPRFSLNWESPSGKLWYFTVGRFFAMPNFYQLFMPSRSFGLPNPDLKPEKGWTWDVGVRGGGEIRPWNLGIFYMDMTDKINYVSDPITWFGQYQNVDEFRAWGVEGEITLPISPTWSYTQGFAWTDAEERPVGGDWVRSGLPRLQLIGRLNWARGPWSGEIEGQWLADRVLNNPVYDDDDIFVLNASVQLKRRDDIFRLGCANLLDREYVLDSQGYVTPERRFFISWEHVF